MPTYFDYLRTHIDGLAHESTDADLVGAGDPEHGGAIASDGELVGIVAELEMLFGALWGEPWPVDEHGPHSGVGDSGAGDSGVGESGVEEAPADAWLSGDEWAGEAEIGGVAFTSGTVDPTGEGNDVFAVDGEVLDLPG